jgi:hypothetical protein
MCSVGAAAGGPSYPVHNQTGARLGFNSQDVVEVDQRDVTGKHVYVQMHVSECMYCTA